MTLKRQEYFRCNTYRNKLKLGDVIYQIDTNMSGEKRLHRGVIKEITKGVRVYIEWDGGIQPNVGLDLDRRGVHGRILAFRVEDLNANERAEFVTLRLMRNT